MKKVEEGFQTAGDVVLIFTFKMLKFRDLYFFFVLFLFFCEISCACVTFMSKGRVPMRLTGSVEQPIELLPRLTH